MMIIRFLATELRKSFWLFLFALLPPLVFADDSPINHIQLPLGFRISIYAHVPDARHMALGDNGIVFVGTQQDKVYALIPNTNKATAQPIIIAQKLYKPNGVAYYKGDLYVAEVTRILKYPNVIKNLHHLPTPITINNTMPNQLAHPYRVIRFSPDGWLYAAIGMPCNTCDYRKKNPMFGTIIRMRPDGSQLHIFAKGIRNSMGFDWHPDTQVLWFTDNGQDYMGDQLPPDEIDSAPKIDMDFGFPFVYGNNIPAPHYENISMATNHFTPPVAYLPAHIAPLGVEFYTGKTFPKKYQRQLFIAEHGSWNRSSKIGYQVVVAFIHNNKVTAVNPFATGWLNPSNEAVYGRPVDVLTMPDGALLVSDDQTGVVYRITYKANPKNLSS